MREKYPNADFSLVLILPYFRIWSEFGEILAKKICIWTLTEA